MSRESGRGGGRGRGDRIEDPYLQEQLKLPEQLEREHEEISELKQRAYKSALWALRMDHQKINWRVELAIVELKKALKITEEVHNKIIQELDNEFSEADDEANRSVEANRKFAEDEGVDPTSENTSPKSKKTSEDEGEDPRAYGENILGMTASIKWAGDGKFKEVVVIDYDMENRRHFLHHVNEKLYEWLDLNELFPEDIRWDHSKGSGRGGRGTGRGGRGSGRGSRGIGESSRAICQREDHGSDEIQLYDIKQLGNMVMKVLEAPTPALLREAEIHLEKQRRYLNIGLQRIAKKAETVGAEGRAVHGGRDGDGNESGDAENRSSDGRKTNLDDEKKSGDDDNPGSTGSGRGRSRNSGAGSGSKRTGSSSGSGSGSGGKRTGSSSSNSNSSSSSGSGSGNGIGNNSDSDD